MALVKKYLIAIVIIIICFFIFFQYKSINNCQTQEQRQQRLSEVENLKNGVTIIAETEIEGYIVSGYITDDMRYQGIAIFNPDSKGNYKFSSNVNRDYGSLVMASLTVQDMEKEASYNSIKNYDIFWANRENLEKAELTYTPEGGEREVITLDATNNKIIYYPCHYKSYNVEYKFYDKDGNVYE
jgi:hypothetical protein